MLFSLHQELDLLLFRCLAYCWALKKESFRTSEPSVNFCRATWRYVYEYNTLYGWNISNPNRWKWRAEIVSMYLINFCYKSGNNCNFDPLDIGHCCGNTIRRNYHENCVGIVDYCVWFVEKEILAGLELLLLTVITEIRYAAWYCFVFLFGILYIKHITFMYTFFCLHETSRK